MLQCCATAASRRCGTYMLQMNSTLRHIARAAVRELVNLAKVEVDPHAPQGSNE